LSEDRCGEQVDGAFLLWAMGALFLSLAVAFAVTNIWLGIPLPVMAAATASVVCTVASVIRAMADPWWRMPR
jgi:hypothetical protein